MNLLPNKSPTHPSRTHTRAHTPVVVVVVVVVVAATAAVVACFEGVVSHCYCPRGYEGLGRTCRTAAPFTPPWSLIRLLPPHTDNPKPRLVPAGPGQAPVGGTLVLRPCRCLTYFTVTYDGAFHPATPVCPVSPGSPIGPTAC